MMHWKTAVHLHCLRIFLLNKNVLTKILSKQKKVKHRKYKVFLFFKKKFNFVMNKIKTAFLLKESNKNKDFIK